MKKIKFPCTLKENIARVSIWHVEKKIFCTQWVYTQMALDYSVSSAFRKLCPIK